MQLYKKPPPSTWDRMTDEARALARISLDAAHYNGKSKIGAIVNFRSVSGAGLTDAQGCIEAVIDERVDSINAE